MSKSKSKYEKMKNDFTNYNLTLKEIIEKINPKVNEKEAISMKNIINISKKVFDKSLAESLKKKDVLYCYYLSATKILDSGGRINTLECGLKLIDSSILLYCIKNEYEEYKFLTNVKNFKEIMYDDYQKEDILDSISRHSEEKITGIENRAYTLESLINFYLKNIFSLKELPNFIVKIAGKANFLYREFDNVLYNNNENEISMTNLKFAIPFNHELIIKFNSINHDKLGINSFITKESLIVVEIKTHFPKENKSTLECEILPTVIDKMVDKLSLLLEIISDFPYNYNQIHLMLFYDQNKLTQYNEKYFIKQLDICKNNYLSDTIQKKYNIYFHIFYTFPSIAKMSLTYVLDKINKIEEERKNDILQFNEERKKNEEERKKYEEERKKNEEEFKIKIDFLEKEIDGLKSIISDNKQQTHRNEDKILKNNNNKSPEDSENTIYDKEFDRIKKKRNENTNLEEFEEAYYQLFLLCQEKSKFFKNYKFNGIGLLKYNHISPEERKIIFHDSFTK